MWTWTAVLLVGLAIVVIYPFLSTSVAADIDTPGVYPQWVIPVGYFLMLIGAGGLVVAWMARRAR
ncbi:hypothetical protein OCGS_0711 [Oceaniovalibus guishaninsula JLT2003]|uniref:Uncharacterized protein n=2 Tax=Oceaniovalibus TaxID=1207070 RepID=K2GQW4_9RHOB|nr:hypothetical protein OCGS_0711 [Oceaniovalibus guishaninsula JLT2003]